MKTMIVCPSQFPARALLPIPTRTQERVGRKISSGWLAILAVCLLFAHRGPAATVAYWRFEGDGTNAPTPNQIVATFAAHTAVQHDGLLAVDASGNGNSVYGWDTSSNALIEYEQVVPGSMVTQTGAANNWSIWTMPLSTSWPSLATWSAKSNPTGGNLETMTPKAWTIEASINSSSFAGYNHTFVGRDGNHVSGNTSLSPLYFQVNYGSAANLVICFADVAGNFYTVQDPASMATNRWYNLAAVSDGTNLFLYKDSRDGKSYQLVGSTALTSTNTALAVPTGTNATMSDGSTWAWSLARGRYGTSKSPGGITRIATSVILTKSVSATRPCPRPNFYLPRPMCILCPAPPRLINRWAWGPALFSM